MKRAVHLPYTQYSRLCVNQQTTLYILLFFLLIIIFLVRDFPTVLGRLVDLNVGNLVMLSNLQETYICGHKRENRYDNVFNISIRAGDSCSCHYSW